jgi:hypothetical protein
MGSLGQEEGGRRKRKEIIEYETSGSHDGDCED